MGIQTIEDIFNYCNENLLDGELDEIQDIINYLNESQNMIAEISPIEAPLVTTVLDSTVKITKPADLQKIKEFTVVSNDGTYEMPIEPLKDWADSIYFNTNLNGRTVNMYYYKKPTVLNANTPTQVPDIDSRYFYNIAQYAAEMYKLKDDDQEAASQYKQKFLEGITFYNKNKATIANFKNVW